MDCRVHGVAKSWTQLSEFHFHVHFHFAACQALLSMVDRAISFNLLIMPKTPAAWRGYHPHPTDDEAEVQPDPRGDPDRGARGGRTSGRPTSPSSGPLLPPALG